MKKLTIVFLNSEGGKHSWVPQTAAEDLTKEEVRKAAEDLISLNLFERNGIALYQQVNSAKYVETIETPLF